MYMYTKHNDVYHEFRGQGNNNLAGIYYTLTIKILNTKLNTKEGRGSMYY